VAIGADAAAQAPALTEPPQDPAPVTGLPFPGSLCHSCAAPPRYVTSDRGSVFIHCPIFKTYPPQPVVACREFRPAAGRVAAVTTPEPSR